jgi:hypothetical protein
MKPDAEAPAQKGRGCTRIRDYGCFSVQSPECEALNVCLRNNLLAEPSRMASSLRVPEFSVKVVRHIEVGFWLGMTVEKCRLEIYLRMGAGILRRAKEALLRMTILITGSWCGFRQRRPQTLFQRGVYRRRRSQNPNQPSAGTIIGMLRLRREDLRSFLLRSA